MGGLPLYTENMIDLKSNKNILVPINDTIPSKVQSHSTHPKIRAEINEYFMFGNCRHCIRLKE